MKHLALASAASLALLAACNQNADSPGQTEPANAVQDAAAAPVGQMSAATLGANTVGGYVPAAAMADMYEIQAAAIAEERSTNAEVKELAGMITRDHTDSSNKLKAMAPTAAPDTTLPTELDQRRMGMLDNLRAAPAADFDRVYLQQQVAAHQEALTLHRGFSDKQDAPQLAGLAREVVPKIEMHLQHAQQLLDGMGA
jgi:putative membrane protein